MAIRLSDIENDERTCTVVYKEEEMAVTYRPSAYTPAVEMEFRAALAANHSGDAFARLLDGLVVSWELLDEDGAEIEPSYEFMCSNLSNAFLVVVTNAITEDMNSEKDARKNSGAPAQRGARRGKSLSGIR